MVRVGVLGTCVASSVLGVLLSGFWIAVAGVGCGGPGSGILGAGTSCPGVLGVGVSGSRGPGSRDPASGILPRGPAPGSPPGGSGSRVPLFRCAQLSMEHEKTQYFASFDILHQLIQ